MVYFACSYGGFAYSHARVSQSAEIRSACCNHVADCLVYCISLGAVSNVMWIINHSEIFLLSETYHV